MIETFREGLSLVFYSLSAFCQDIANKLSTTVLTVTSVDYPNATITVARPYTYKVGDKVYIGR